MTAPYYGDENVTLWHGDCLDVLRELADNSIDAVCTDPPYALEFMGRGWDKFTPLEFELWCSQWATECLRVLKPGGHLLAFGGTRTWHRLASGIEDAGFEVRDNLAWLYGSGFPKSLDVSKAIDKRGGRPDLAPIIAAAIKEARESRGWTTGEADRYFCGGSTNWTWYEGRKGECRPPTPADFARIAAEWPELAPLAEQVAEASREVVGQKSAGIAVPGEGVRYTVGGSRSVTVDVTAPATDHARTWAGWGTALKPAFEPIVVARKPLAGTVAHNVLTHGTGALNIDASRVGTTERPAMVRTSTTVAASSMAGQSTGATASGEVTTLGRWPANVLLGHAYDCGTDQAPGPCVDGCPVRELDQQSGVLTSGANPTRRGSDKFRDTYGEFSGQAECAPARGADSGGASRFFPTFRYEAKAPTSERPREGDTAHPTVKPLALMQWLVRLVTPPGGTVLEPFAGSGTTAEACVLEGFTCIAIEREPTYLPLIVQRLSKPLQPDLFGGAA